ncbi:MAG: hypothetical protein U0401_23835 [Anaerolineae bacterium]
MTLVDEGISEIDRDIEADLIGISAITGTAPRSLADGFRRRGISRWCWAATRCPTKLPATLRRGGGGLR